MSCLTNSIAQGDPFLHELVEKTRNAPSLAMLIIREVLSRRLTCEEVRDRVLTRLNQRQKEWLLAAIPSEKLRGRTD